jgi:aryl-alcohol dehydrogenase-like predicted oxidoreductase
MVAIAEKPAATVKTAQTEGALRPLTKRLPYGPTGIPVSRLCWGTGLMAVLKHNLSHGDAAKVLVRGLELGVNFWDTADGYKTHPHVGEALREVGKGNRERVVVNTKTKAKTAEEAREDVERFLQEMGTEYIDTILLHGIETTDELERRHEALDELQRIKASGKVKGVGISTHLGTGAIMDRCAADGRIEVILTTVNVDGQMLKGSMEAHRPLVERVFGAKKGITLMKTLAQGGLTKTPEMVREAIRFNLSLPYAHSVCVGVNSVEEVEFAVRVAAELE